MTWEFVSQIPDARASLCRLLAYYRAQHAIKEAMVFCCHLRVVQQHQRDCVCSVS
jgi:hypothetical protein